MAIRQARRALSSRLATTFSRSVATSGCATQQMMDRTMPPGFAAQVGQLETFVLPETVCGSAGDRRLGNSIVNAWRRDGIFQIAMTEKQQRLYHDANSASRVSFAMPQIYKAVCVDAQSYAGYISSGEELTDGIADYSEVFTVTKDLPVNDPRVVDGWPCHGPCPWPNADMKRAIEKYMADLSTSGEVILQLVELGLDVPLGSLTRYTGDGWHHLRLLRFPPLHDTNGKGRAGRGIGSHTDYGLLVMAAQDEIGGLFVRPPSQDERFANWGTSTAGLREDEPGWLYVPPVPQVFTVFPGDMMQYMTNSALVATPHKVGLNTRERFAFAYFHEPNFRAIVRPLSGYDAGQEPREGVHYGTHFTNMFMRNYPDRITTQNLISENRYQLLKTDKLRCEMT